MKNQLLFENLHKDNRGLSPQQRKNAIDLLTKKMRFGTFFYTIPETCSILRCSRERLQTIIDRYRLDVVLFLSVPRVPWYDLLAFLLTDHDDTLKKDYSEYIRKMIRKRKPQGKTKNINQKRTA